MTDHLENFSMSPNPDTEDTVPEIIYPELTPDEQRLHFVQRCRTFLRGAVINRLGPLSDKALMHIAEQRGFDFLEHANCYQDRQCYESVLKTAAKSSVGLTPWKTLEHAVLFNGKDWEEEVLLQASRRCRGIHTIRNFAPQIKNEAIRKKVLAIADKLEKRAKK